MVRSRVEKIAYDPESNPDFYIFFSGVLKLKLIFIFIVKTKAIKNGFGILFKICLKIFKIDIDLICKLIKMLMKYNI